MAGNTDLGTAGFSITGDARGAQNAASQANSALAQMEQVVAQNWWGLQNLAAAFSALPAAVAAGVGAAIQAAIQWEDAMAGVEKTTYDSNKSVEENAAALGELDAQLTELAKSKPIPPVEIAGIAEAAGALGVAQENVASFTSTVTDFAAVSNATSDQAATDLARIAGLTNTPAIGYDNLASSIIEAGRATAATETDILSLTQRIAGSGAVAGLAADEIVGIAAAVRSTGQGAESGGTAINKTLTDIGRAVSSGGEQLQVFADTAGMSADEFRQKWENEPAQAFLAFIQGTGQMISAGENVDAMLAQLGITETRQAETLKKLGVNQVQTANSSLQLSTILGIANESFVDGTTLADLAARRYQTFSAQLQMLKNEFFAVGAEIGQHFLPILKVGVDMVGDFLRGFQALPAPLKGVLAALVGVATIFSAIAAAALLIVPRVVLAQQSLRQLAQVRAAAKAAADAERNAEANLAAATRATAAANEHATRTSLLEARAASEVIAAKQRVLLLDREAAALAINLANIRSRQQAANSAYTQADLALSQARIEMAIAEGNAQALAYSNPARAAQILRAAKQNLLLAEQNLMRARVELSVVDSQAARASSQHAQAAQRLAIAQREVAVAERTAALAAAENAAAQQAAAAAVTAEGNAAAAAAAKNNVNTASMTRMRRASIAMAGILIAGTVATTAFGSSVDDASESADKAVTSVKELEDAFTQGGRAGREAANNWISEQLAMDGLRGTANELGIEYQDMLAIIRGTASANDVAVFQNAVQAGMDSGVQGSEELRAKVAQLAEQFRVSADEARILGATTNDIDAVRGLDVPESDFGRSAEEIEAYRKAVYDLSDAQERAEDAARDVSAAEDGLAEARRRASNSAHIIRAAELTLARARLSQQQAAADVQRAERNLSTARARQARDVADAVETLDDARRSESDAIERVSELEEQLAEARQGPELQDYLDATVKLGEAQKNLRDANQAVADSQWYLNYLREEGAGARDIREAEDALADSHLDVASATADLTEAEKELRDLQNQTEQKKEIARLEKEIAEARESASDASRAVADAEDELYEKRQDAANDTFYKDAQGELLDAQLRQQEAILETSDAEAELNDLRGGSLADDVAEAEDALADAYRDQAEAITDVIEQLTILSGGTFTDSDRAQALADNLEAIKDSIPAGPERDQLQTFIDQLREIEDTGDVTTEVGVEVAPGGVDVGAALEGSPTSADLAEADRVGSAMTQAITFAMLGSMGGPVGALGAAMASLVFSTFQKAAENEGGAGEVINGIFRNIGAALTGGDVELTEYGQEMMDDFWRGVEMTFSPSALRENFSEFGTNLFYALRLAVFYAAGGHDLLSFLFDDQGNVATPLEVVENLKNIGRDFVQGLWDGATEKFGEFLLWLGRWWEDIVERVKEALGIRSPSWKMAALGRDLIQGLKDGAVERFWEFLGWIGGIGQAALDTVGNTGETLYNKGHSLLGGFYNGGLARWRDFADWLRGLPERAKTAITTAISGDNPLLQVGRDIIQGLWDGITERWDDLLDDWGWLVDRLPGKLKEILGISSPSKVFMGLGGNIADGLGIGLNEGMRHAQRDFENQMAGWNADKLAEQFQKFGLDGYDFTAYTGNDSNVAYTPSVAAPMSGAVAEKVIERTEPHYHLEAITDANPNEIFAAYSWGELGHTRGAVR